VEINALLNNRGLELRAYLSILLAKLNKSILMIDAITTRTTNSENCRFPGVPKSVA
jgi:hypothetical protein